MIDSIKKFGRWIIRVALYLWGKKIFCIALLLFVGAIFFILYMPDKTSTDRFRYTGLVLELFGIFTVSYGLYETLKSFGRTLRSIISESFKGFPKFRDNSHNVASINIGFLECTLSSFVPSDLAPNSSIEDRVTFLEEQFKQVHLQAHENRIHFENEFKKSTDALNAERSEREASVEKVRQMLEKFAVEGLAIEAMGVVCLVFGAIFATASSELACFFDSFPVLLITLNSE